MSEKSINIKSMIIPLDSCPRLYEDQTLDEAIALFALATSEDNQVLLPVLLVLDKKDNLSGMLSRADILRGLVPNMLEAARPGKFAGQNTEYPNLTYLYEDHALAECGGNRTRQVRFLMHPVDFTLSAETHILEAIVLLHRHNASCVPVTEDEVVVGMLRFDELFHAMCNTWCRLPQA